jgi:hypothetical protein
MEIGSLVFVPLYADSQSDKLDVVSFCFERSKDAKEGQRVESGEIYNSSHTVQCHTLTITIN